MESENVIDQEVWWGSFELAPEEVGCWQVGPTTLWLYRALQEWRMVYTQTRDAMDSRSGVEMAATVQEMQQRVEDATIKTTIDRFPFHQTAAKLQVYPALADRAMVIRPETPLHILPDEAARLYVSSPLWLGIEVGRGPRKLAEIASYRPSDTWFGPSTREGELCYAVRTNGRLNLESLPRRLHRAITPVHVRNRGSDSMLLDRLQLPVQYLSLFQAENNYLWTQAVTMQRQQESDLASIRLAEGAPKEAAGGTLIREPRLNTKDNLIMRTFGAFSSLFS
jgi:hypothetical protein